MSLFRRAQSLSLVVKDGVAYKKSRNKLTRVDENSTSDTRTNNTTQSKKPSWRRNSLKGTKLQGKE